MSFMNCRDQMGFEVNLPAIPQRIISLVPSQTELLFTLGLDSEVAGITKFCIHPPEWHRRKTIIGGTKQFDFERIAGLAPDLIIGNKEENYREGIEELRKTFPVWMSDITTLEDALSMIRSVGALTGRGDEAAKLAGRIDNDFQQLKPVLEGTVLYLIWRDPWMAVGKQTFIDDMLTRAGFRNVIQRSRYPLITEKEMATLEPNHVFLSSEPYPFREKHIDEIEKIFRSSKIRLVDGEMFSWYGSRLLFTCDYFRKLYL